VIDTSALYGRDGHPVTPLAIVAPIGYQFSPPPGNKMDAQFKQAHDIKSEKDSRSSKIFAAEMERAEKIGAGVEDANPVPDGDSWNTDYCAEIEDDSDEEEDMEMTGWIVENREPQDE
jgi:hypothetical protein